MKKLERKVCVQLTGLIIIILSDRISDDDLVPYLMIKIKDFIEENYFENPELTNEILLDLTLTIYFRQRNEPKNLLRASLISHLYHILHTYE